MKILMIKYRLVTVSETFIKAQAEKIDLDITLYHGPIPMPYGTNHDGIKNKLYTHGSKLIASITKFSALIYRSLVSRVLKREKPDLVFIQYGSTAALMYRACIKANIPYVIHFHGFDAHRTAFLKKHRKAYKKMLAKAAAVIVVSDTMKDNLVRLGANPANVVLNPCGIDTDSFKEKTGADYFLSVGRFVDKKAPQNTIKAFAKVLKEFPDKRLYMIGTGPLLGTCQELAKRLGMQHAIEFLGAKNHDVVKAYMMNTFVFLQHSVTAPDGDSEGSPVAITEAAACGIPVVSTFHAGIPEIVKHGETGFLVAEGDVEGMAEAILKLIKNPELYQTMSKKARLHIMDRFDQENQLVNLKKTLSQSNQTR